MGYESHPVFVAPENPDARLWRYMDFTKLVSLLDRAAVFFARADKLGDPFEGSFSAANIRLRPEIYKDIPDDQRENMLRQFTFFHRHLPSFTAISCWHEQEYESAAMWQTYLRSESGVAVQTTFRALTEAFQGEETIMAGRVRYLDYESEWLPEGNSFYPFIHKRKSFEHEKEIRAVIQSPATDEDDQPSILETGRWHITGGLYVPVDLGVLVHSVRLAPNTPIWFEELARSVTRRYGLSAPVHRSDMDRNPVF